MGDAAKPAEQRRGPLGIQHPLEPAIDPETGDPITSGMPNLLSELSEPSKPAPKRQPERLPGRDQFNLDPVAKGWVRGRTANMVRTFDTTPYGQLMTYQFDVIFDKKQPPLKVEMQGYTFSKELRPGMVVEAHVGDTVPTERQRIDRMRLPLDPNNDLRAYRPVQQRAALLARSTRFGVIALLAPLVVVGLLLLLGSLYVW